MRGHQIERAKFGAPAKSFESQRRASLCQEVRWNPVVEGHGWFGALQLCRGVNGLQGPHRHRDVYHV